MTAASLIIAAPLAVGFLGVARPALAAEPVNVTADAGTEKPDEGSAEGESDVHGGTIGLGLEKGVLVPIGDWRDFQGIGLGLLPRLEYRLSERFALTVNPGLVFRLSFFPSFHGGSTGASTTEVLLLGGAKYMLAPKLAVHGEAGLNVRTLWGDAGGTNARVALMVGTGYAFWESWALGANLFIPNLAPVDTGENVNTGVMLSISHGFM